MCDVTSYIHVYSRLLLLPSDVAQIVILAVLLLLYVIWVFPCHCQLDHRLSQGKYRILNVRDDFSACYAHEGETGTEKSAHVNLKIRRTVLHSVSTGRGNHVKKSVACMFQEFVFSIVGI